MLSDEERELIEEIQKGNKIGIYELIRTFKREGIENFITVRRKYIDIMINLIEKQSKEIEEYKKQLDLDYVDKHFVPIERYNQLEKDLFENCSNYVVSKDKIRAKIEELEKLDFGTDLVSQFTANLTTITILQSLLEKE